jgi:hypothetical protein
MEVIRDQLWQECLVDAVKMHRLKEPDERCYKLADATWKCKMAYKRHKDKKDQRQVIMIDKPPEPTVTQRSQTKICCATTLSGKPCSFKAVCGDYCKKHRIDKEVIGKKIPVYSK